MLNGLLVISNLTWQTAFLVISNLTWLDLTWLSFRRVLVCPGRWQQPTLRNVSGIKISRVKIPGSECQTSGTNAKRAKQAIKKDNCLCFLYYLAFLRPAADRAVSILPWVVSPGRSYEFLWAVRLFKKICEEGQSNSGLYASKRSKTSHGACWSPLGVKSS
jgi:hypothetical protein